jgi:hypothetical protein
LELLLFFFCFFLFFFVYISINVKQHTNVYGWLMIYESFIYDYRPHDDGSDSDDSDEGKLVIDVSSDAGDNATPLPLCSSVSSHQSVVNLPTGNGVFSPFLPAPSPGAHSDYCPKPMSVASQIGGGAMYTVEEEMERLQELDLEELINEIGDLGEGSPCISLLASSGPPSWTEGSDNGGALIGACGEDGVAVMQNGAADQCPDEPAAPERSPVVQDRRVVTPLDGKWSPIRTPDRRQDPVQAELEMTLLDARGQLPTRRCKSNCLLKYS